MSESDVTEQYYREREIINQAMKPLRREDLETLLGIAPIYSYFVMPKKQMKYIYNDKVAILDCHVEAPFEGWLNMEAETCRKVFLSSCQLCDQGFPINASGYHYGTQRLGMIPNTPCKLRNV